MSQQQEWTHEPRFDLGESLRVPDGPWMHEPDKVQWVDDETDLDCLAVRNQMGAWCGYVGVPPGHPTHGKGYRDVDVQVHGGLTFADSCDEDAPEGHGICHVPLPGRAADVWWLGFDCGHGTDIVPASEALALSHNWPKITPPWGAPTYKTLAYVQRECHELAVQLAELTT